MPLFLTGYSQTQRLNLRGFDILQNIQIGRLFDIKGWCFSPSCAPILLLDCNCKQQLFESPFHIFIYRWKCGSDLHLSTTSGGRHLALLHQPTEMRWSQRRGWQWHDARLIPLQTICHPYTWGCRFIPGKVRQIHIFCTTVTSLWKLKNACFMVIEFTEERVIYCTLAPSCSM